MILSEFIALRGEHDPHSTRLAFITDLHVRNRPPRMRKDDYAAALLQKVDWVCKTAKRLDCLPQIIGGGDIFDRPDVNLERVDDFADVFLQNNCSLVTAFGNHDVDSSLASAPRSVLGHLMRRTPNVVRPLPILSQQPLTLGNPEIHLWAHHYKYNNHVDHQEDPDQRGLTLEPDIPSVDGTRVIISHSMVLKTKPIFDDHLYTLFDEVKTNAHVVLLGHYHPQQEMTLLQNPYQTLIGGPGAMMRGALSRDDLNRRPAMALLQVRKIAGQPKEITVDFIDIEVAAPAADIFKLEEAQAEARKSEALDAFRLNLDSLKVQGLSVAGLIEEIAKNEKIPDAIKSEALRRIGAQ